MDAKEDRKENKVYSSTSIRFGNEITTMWWSNWM